MEYFFSINDLPTTCMLLESFYYRIFKYKKNLVSRLPRAKVLVAVDKIFPSILPNITYLEEGDKLFSCYFFPKSISFNFEDIHHTCEVSINIKKQQELYWIEASCTGKPFDDWYRFVTYHEDLYTVLYETLSYLNYLYKLEKN